jgi:hypothetical protein
MAAFATGKPAVRKGYHRPELGVRDAVRAPNYGRSHGDIPHMENSTPLTITRM